MPMLKSLAVLSTIAVAAQAVSVIHQDQNQDDQGNKCWIRLPTGCPNQTQIRLYRDFYKRPLTDPEGQWFHDIKGHNSDTPAKCQHRISQYNPWCKHYDTEAYWGPHAPVLGLSLDSFEAALESEATWSTYINAKETTTNGLKALKVTRNSAVVVYFEKKVLQATSANAVITDDSDAKTKLAASKTAEASKTTADTASKAADKNKTEALNNFMAHLKKGWTYEKSTELNKTLKAKSDEADTARAKYILADENYSAAKALSDTAATRAATSKTTASAAVSAVNTAKAAALEAHKAFANGHEASYKAGTSY